MLNEVKILFNNIKSLRHLITEAVSETDMEKYVNNHEYIYIYYAGDGTTKSGYRTIRPYVLGTNTAGNMVIRAWQDRGKSADFQNRPTRPDSFEHDYWKEKNGEVAGWRMFRLDKIEKLYPIGKKFHNSDGTVMIPPKYKEGSDSDIPNIIAYVSTKTSPEREVQPTAEPTTGKQTKWDNFTRGNKNNRKITADDVAKLRDIASRVYKKNRGSFLVAINNNNEFELIDVRDKEKVPQAAIVGNLPNLYDTLVKGNAPADEKFFNSTKEKTASQLKNQQKNTESPTIPFEKKPFFKP